MTSMELIRGGDDLTMVRIVPPQTKTFAFEATKGAYLFSIDVSGSMNAAAEVQQEERRRLGSSRGPCIRF